ncbi:hypothetical protein UA75_07820 [Actinoalloteichus sp. GBA129-24]|nr:hypothetical protein UA75_07820 [Actinoalloteichus sp. GBA129-24]
MRPRGPQDSPNLLVGDYLQFATVRPPAYGCAVDEGFARVARIERVPAEVASRVLDSAYVDGLSLAVMWCHGAPGPVVVSSGDVCVLDWASEHRAQHDRQHPWWPPALSFLFPGAVPAGVKPPPRRRIPEPLRQPVAWATPTITPKAPVRATGFTKPASALRIGDYLRVHADRRPVSDQDIDKGWTQEGPNGRRHHLRRPGDHSRRRRRGPGAAARCGDYPEATAGGASWPRLCPPRNRATTCEKAERLSRDPFGVLDRERFAAQHCVPIAYATEPWNPVLEMLPQARALTTRPELQLLQDRKPVHDRTRGCERWLGNTSAATTPPGRLAPDEPPELAVRPRAATQPAQTGQRERGGCHG